MKKFSFLILLSLFLATVSLHAQTIVLAESFEDGIPSTWTQENVEGTQMWAVEADGTFPNGAFDGIKRAFLRNDLGQTLGYKTLLITPEMDLVDVYQPILKFAHAQAKWTADVDTMRVYYKSAEKDDWKLLMEFSQPIGAWREEVLELPAVSSTYRLAFEGTDNLGRGIVLDNVIVRSKPECTVPHDLYVTNMVNSGVTIGWQASLDANYFQIVLTTIEINPDTLDLVDKNDIALNYNALADSTVYRAEGLASGQYYWLYVRSLCDNEISDWGTYAFRLNIKEKIPYSDNFNMDYAAGMLGRRFNWTYGNNTGATNPYICSDIVPGSVDIAKYSKDKSSCLVFSGGNNATTAIPAASYVYAATPELTGEDLKNCQVRFSATVAGYTGRDNACGIIIGVMNDPDNLETFVPVDTVTVWGNLAFEEAVVSLAQYNGKGNYICFLSRFDKPNRIYIDNVLIERRPQLPIITDLKVIPSSSSASLEWGSVASSYNVLITTEPVSEPDNAPENVRVIKKTVDSNKCDITGLSAGHGWDRPYFAYVQAISAETTGEWSDAVPFITVSVMGQLPVNYDFELTSGCYYLNGNTNYPYANGFGTFGNDNNEGWYPYLNIAGVSNNYAYKGTGCLYLDKTHGTDAWVTLPELVSTDVKNVQISFYLSGHGYFKGTRLAVGVMTNPLDISTFEQIDEFSCGSADYFRCFTSFAEYTGSGRFIALKWLDNNLGSKTYVYIDELEVDTLSACIPPTGIHAVPSDTAVNISWNKGGQTDWRVVVSTEALSNDELDEVELATKPSVIMVQDVSVPNTTLTHLNHSTTYFTYVGSLCSDGDRMWSSAYAFTTECPAVITLPYTETFDRFGTGTAVRPGCWMSDFAWSKAYPYIASTYNHSMAGVGSLYMYSNVASSPTSNSSVIVAPLMDLPLDKIAVSFYTYAQNAGMEIYVGVMSDPYDFSTFEQVAVCPSTKTAEWEEQHVDFANYLGTGKYIAFSTRRTKDYNAIYMDDVTFSSNTCIQPFNIRSTSISSNSLTIEWDSRTTDKWQVIVSAKPVAYHDSVISTVNATDLITDTIVTSNLCFVDGLKTFTNYYCYVRPTCGDKLWGDATLITDCNSINPLLNYHENFEKWATGAGKKPDCWTVKNNGSVSTSYIPYVNNSTLYASSGSKQLRIYSYYSSSTKAAPAWAASPRIAIDNIDQVTVSFYACSQTNGHVCIFGMMTDPEDLSTFVTLDSISLTNKPVLQEYALSDYDNIIGNARYLAWRTPYGVTQYAFIDDVIVMTLGCPNPKPTISNITYESAVVASNLRVSAPWHLMLMDQEVPTDSLESETYKIPSHVNVLVDTVLNENTRSFKFTGLEEQNSYFCAVTTICDQRTSMWIGNSFKTVCKPISVADFGVVSFEETEGFIANGDTKCWIVGNKTNTLYPASVVKNSTTAHYSHKGEQSMHLYSYASANGAYFMTQALADSIGKLQVSFFGYATSNTSYQQQLLVGVITDPADMATFVPMDTVDATDESKPYVVKFDEYEGDYMGNYGSYICFLSEFDKANHFYVDDISIEYIPSCPRPISVVVDSIGEDWVALSWKGSVADRHRICLAYDEIPDTLTETAIYPIDTLVYGGNNAVIRNLKGGTEYFAYVKAICSESEQTTFSLDRVEMHTLCPSQQRLPYAIDFDHNSATGISVLPDCWIGLYEGSADQKYPCVTNTAARGNGFGLELASSYVAATSTYAVTPSFAVESLGDYMLSFYARRDQDGLQHQGKLVVGYVLDPSRIKDTFHPLDTIDITSTSFHHYYFDLTPFKDQLRDVSRIALLSDASITKKSFNNIYIDKFVVTEPINCYPSEFVFTSSTQTTASFVISPANSNDTKWQIVVVPENEYEKVGDIENVINKGALYTVVDKNALVDNLTPGMSYYAFVRTMCSDSDMSDWCEEGVKFNTKYRYTDSYFFGFEKSEDWILSPMSTSETMYIHPALEAFGTSAAYCGHSIENTGIAIYASTGSGALQLSSTKDNVGAAVIFPAVENSRNSSFSFDVRPGHANASGTYAEEQRNAAFVIGTVDKDKGLSTLTRLASVVLPVVSTTTQIEEDNSGFKHYVINFDAASITDKQIVLALYKPYDAEVCFDNVKLDEAENVTTPLISAFSHTDTDVELKWFNADAVNVYVIPEGRSHSIDNAVASVTNTSNQNVRLTGLTPGQAYTLYVELASAPVGTKTLTYTSRSFNTPCQKKQLDANSRFVIDFETDISAISSETDPLYWMPDCWNILTNSPSTVKTPYYNWLIQRDGYNYTSSPTTSTTYKNYVSAYSGSHALRCFNNSSNYKTPYAVLPLVDAGLDSMQLEFMLRPFVHNLTSNKIVSASYTSGTYVPAVVVGSMTDPNDISTFAAIDTVIYPVSGLSTSTVVTADPEHTSYWRKMIVPTSEATGKYLALTVLNTLAIIDDVTLTPRTGILPPKGLYTIDLSSDSVLLGWTRVWQPELKTIITVYSEDMKVIVCNDTIEGAQRQYTVRGLDPDCVYYWSLRQTNGIETSGESMLGSFQTECKSITPSYTLGFENEEGWHQKWGAGFNYTACTTYGNALGGGSFSPTSVTWPWNQGSSGTNAYARTGNYALSIGASSTVVGYMTLPRMDDMAAFDTLQLEFWGCPAYRNSSTGKIANVTLSGTAYAKSMEVGTCTDPNDPSTFAPIRIVTYSLPTLTTQTIVSAANDFGYERFQVPLKDATGPYVYIKASLNMADGTAKNSSGMYLDDIRFVPYRECNAPSHLAVDSVSTEGIWVEWTGETDRYVVQLATNGDFSDANVVASDTVSSMNYAFEGLKPSTVYYFRVKGMCSTTDESAWSSIAQTKTVLTPYFLEDFRDVYTNDVWKYSAQQARLVFQGNPIKATTTAYSFGWQRTTSSYGMKGAHYFAPFYCSQSNSSAYNYYWFITPKIKIEEGKNAHINFTLGLSQAIENNTKACQYPAAENNVDKSFVFMMVVSDDGGVTWKRENAVVWGMVTGAYDKPDYKLDELTIDGVNYEFDLSKYAGKTICVGFYRENLQYLPISSAIHLGNVRINYVINREINDTFCQFEDADAFDFHINGDNVNVGLNSMKEYVLASELDNKVKQVDDTAFIFNANYMEAPQVNYSATICEGVTFTEYGFSSIGKQGVYRRKLTSAVTGCDSIVTLNLGVTPTVRYNEEANLCPGETYQWNGKILNRSGLYRDTTTSLVTGCDSISSLVLTYLNAGDTITKEVTITEDDLPYTYESITYPVGTKPGVYTDTIYVQSGECKGVLIHKLTINVGADLEQIIDMNALQSGVHKLLIREQLYIVRDGKWYDALGKSVKCPL